MMLWAWAGVPLGVYTIVERFNVALQIQPQMRELVFQRYPLMVFFLQRTPQKFRKLLKLDTETT